MKVLTCPGLTILAFATLGPVLSAQASEPTASCRNAVVVHAELPPYPPNTHPDIAATVRVKATIGNDGHVLTASAVEGPEWLRPSLEPTALLWQFVPIPDDGPCDIILTFIFMHPDVAEAPTSLRVTYDDPFTVRLHYTLSTVRWLPRVDGLVPDRRCPIHGDVMQFDLVPIEYGLAPMWTGKPSRRETRQADEYFTARDNLFPNVFHAAGGGCVVGVERKAEVQYCESCRRAEAAWALEHPKNGYAHP
jgi:hypothetical protein